MVREDAEIPGRFFSNVALGRVGGGKNYLSPCEKQKALILTSLCQLTRSLSVHVWL